MALKYESNSRPFPEICPKRITMKTTLLKYGPIALGIMLAFFLFSMVVGQNLDYGMQEILGYLSMLVALSVIYFAIRHYRDEVRGGELTFGAGLGLGMIISLLSGVGAAIADVIFTTVVEPDFMEKFTETELARLKDSLPPEEYEQASAELLEQMAAFGSPAILAALMFITVVMIGFVISLISAFLLKRPAVAG